MKIKRIRLRTPWYLKPIPRPAPPLQFIVVVGDVYGRDGQIHSGRKRALEVAKDMQRMFQLDRPAWLVSSPEHLMGMERPITAIVGEPHSILLKELSWRNPAIISIHHG